MDLFFLGFFFLVFLLWTGHALTHGDTQSVLGKTFRRLMLALSFFSLSSQPDLSSAINGLP